MGSIVAGLGSSHAFTFINPEHWDTRRVWNRSMYTRRYNHEPPEQSPVALETDEVVGPRYARVQDRLARLRDLLVATRPDALIVIGDDQNENYSEENMPQFAIFVGESFKAFAHGEDGGTFRCPTDLAEALLVGCVEQGIDLAFSRRFPNDELKSHAHGPPLRILTPERDIPIVPFFVNAIHYPAPEPARCYAVGQALRRVIDARPAGERVALYASGGLSHFTAGYPWKAYNGPSGYGDIATDFDEGVVADMRAGRGSKLAQLTAKDLLAHGDIELRSWIILLGALGDQPATEVIYEPFFRALTGMAVGRWELGNGNGSAHGS